MTVQPPTSKSSVFTRKRKSYTVLVVALVIVGWGLYTLAPGDGSASNNTDGSEVSAEFAPTLAQPVITTGPSRSSRNTTDAPSDLHDGSVDEGASGGMLAHPATTVESGPMLGAVGAGASDETLASSGFKEVVVDADWLEIEPGEGKYSTSATATVQDAINDALAAGLSPSLDIGVQYAPSWIFGVGGGTQFVDQYGDVFTGSQASGNDVANAVTDMSVRSRVGDYINYLGSHLTGLSSVRLGGEANNELSYPSGDAGSQPNAYWFYDASSQATLSGSLKGWKPGTGTSSQATEFINAYDDALVNYGVWLEQTAVRAFPSDVKLEVLLPGWGERPGDLHTAGSNLLSDAPPEVNQGLDWADLLSRLPATGRVVAYTTYADATQGVADDPDPATYIHSILPTGMLEGGESTGNGQSTAAGMNLEFIYAKKWNWYVANWFFNGQPQTPAQLESAFNSH